MNFGKLPPLHNLRVCPHTPSATSATVDEPDDFDAAERRAIAHMQSMVWKRLPEPEAGSDLAQGVTLYTDKLSIPTSGWDEAVYYNWKSAIELWKEWSTEYDGEVEQSSVELCKSTIVAVELAIQNLAFGRGDEYSRWELWAYSVVEEMHKDELNTTSVEALATQGPPNNTWGGLMQTGWYLYRGLGSTSSMLYEVQMAALSDWWEVYEREAAERRRDEEEEAERLRRLREYEAAERRSTFYYMRNMVWKRYPAPVEGTPIARGITLYSDERPSGWSLGEYSDTLNTGVPLWKAWADDYAGAVGETAVRLYKSTLDEVSLALSKLDRGNKYDYLYWAGRLLKAMYNPALNEVDEEAPEALAARGPTVPVEGEEGPRWRSRFSVGPDKYTWGELMKTAWTYYRALGFALLDPIEVERANAARAEGLVLLQQHLSRLRRDPEGNALYNRTNVEYLASVWYAVRFKFVVDEPLKAQILIWLSEGGMPRVASKLWRIREARGDWWGVYDEGDEASYEARRQNDVEFITGQIRDMAFPLEGMPPYQGRAEREREEQLADEDVNRRCMRNIVWALHPLPDHDTAFGERKTLYEGNSPFTLLDRGVSLSNLWKMWEYQFALYKSWNPTDLGLDPGALNLCERTLSKLNEVLLELNEVQRQGGFVANASYKMNDLLDTIFNQNLNTRAVREVAAFVPRVSIDGTPVEAIEARWGNVMRTGVYYYQHLGLMEPWIGERQRSVLDTWTRQDRQETPLPDRILEVMYSTAYRASWKWVTERPERFGVASREQKEELETDLQRWLLDDGEVGVSRGLSGRARMVGDELDQRPLDENSPAAIFAALADEIADMRREDEALFAAQRAREEALLRTEGAAGAGGAGDE